MSKEDQMVQSLIENSKSYKGSLYTEVEVEPEAHYNHYGNRGVADLFVRSKEEGGNNEVYYSDGVYEIKSEAAVRSSTGANEIIRQFNKMRKYFYKDDSRSLPDDCHFELTFIPTEITVQHMVDNLSLYQSSQKKKLCGEIDPDYEFGESLANICFRDNSDGIGQPASIYSPRTDIHDGTSWKSMLEGLGGTSSAKVVEILDKLDY